MSGWVQRLVHVEPATKWDSPRWVCHECGALIARTKIAVHREWHRRTVPEESE